MRSISISSMAHSGVVAAIMGKIMELGGKLFNATGAAAIVGLKVRHMSDAVLLSPPYLVSYLLIKR
ncbi:hypothetical protein D3C71_2151800 [compost metagenome]